MQVDNYLDKEGKQRYNYYVLVEELEFLESKKEKNEFKDLKTKTQVQDQLNYDSSDLPF